jgi:HlyD family secretion protein
VAASFTTPQLFQIARDLTKMQIDTSVSEADVGSLKEGRRRRFVVDAYPDKEFSARMRQFRLAANVVQNVVTYNVVLDVDNQDELLKPGMTAQVRLLVGNRQNVLRMPTAALRFRLSDEEIEKQKKRCGWHRPPLRLRPAPARCRRRRTAGRRRRLPQQGRPGAPVPHLHAGRAQPAEALDVKIGLSNFRYTEMVGGELKKGDKVITRAIGGEKEGGM